MKRGRPTRQDKLVSINARISPELKASLQSMANAKGRSLSNLIAWILSQAVEVEMETAIGSEYRSPRQLCKGFI